MYLKGPNFMTAQLFVVTLVLTSGTVVAQTAPANPPQKDQTTAQTATTRQAGANSATELPQMKTSAYKGVLVDMSCAAGTTSTAGSASAEAAPAKSTNRSAADSGSNCPVSANSSNIGMKLDDGRTVRFDLVGSQRAADALKNDKRWSKNLADGKPIRAKAIGALNGDKLIVASIQ